MDHEQLAQWQAADIAFDRWLDLPASGRDDWLAAQDLTPPVRRRLEQLIAAHERPRAALAPDGSNLAGCQLGDWTLDSELGRGGMAVVYRAWREQGVARQQAAVKILTLGALGAIGRERFRREAEILARLNHPNVTALVDSGVAEDGTFWLAMPLVDGERIDHWCDAKALDARAIVRLHLQVCGAVAYAHRNLVIHRDLKPSNVLVDADGQVRLLDFGIGQFTDVESERTHTMWRALTPGYAAPEQLRGDPPSTAIDIYGLGALLHRLLTGRTPQGTTGGADTTRPSLLVRATDDAYHRHYLPLKTDLDRVLLKALAEEPEQRYATAEALADDLRRWLDGRPVMAQKPGLGYRARKFVGRNRVGVAAAVLLAASLAGGIGATLWQARETQREAENARIQAQRATRVRDFLQRVFESTEPAAGGVPDALELLDEGARRARADVLSTDPLAAADILMLTGRARLALSEHDDARADLEQARALFAATAPEAYRERADIEGELAQVARVRGEVDAALLHSRAAMALGERALAEHGDPETLLAAKVSLGMTLFASDPQAAKILFEEVLAALPSHGLQDTVLHITALDGLGVTLGVTDPEDTRRVLEVAEEQIRLSRRIDGPESGHYATTLSDMVPDLGRAGDHVRAEQVAFEAAAIADRAYTKPHSGRARVHCQLAAHLQWRGRYAEAVEHFAIANDIARQLQLSDLHVQACFLFGAYSRAVTGDYQGALEDVQRSWEIVGQHDYRQSPMGYATCGTQAAIELRLGNLRGAESTLAACPTAEGDVSQLQHAQARAELHRALGRLDEAAALATEVRKTRPPEAGDRYWMRPWMLSVLLAHQRGQADAVASLTAELGEHATTPPLSHCLAQPNETSCLALP
ncbi:MULTISPECIES: protein kinase domain-containing protein [unclassified Luteimonas]